tara:strand:+ start:494 stop:826 length:333 start_codon:yes stop_codon:yes gene_type:complete
MRNWGVGLIICGAFTIIGILGEPWGENSRAAAFQSLLMVVGGGYLANKGQKYLNLMREVSEESLKQLREKEYIDCFALSKKFQISEIEMREILKKSQNKNFIPFGVLIKH